MARASHAPAREDNRLTLLRNSFETEFPPSGASQGSRGYDKENAK